MGYPEGYILLITNTNFVLLNGPIPDCGLPAPSCTLNINSVSSTNETILDAGDGTITVNVTKTGGTMTYTISSGYVIVTASTTLSAYTFTNVPSGQWDVRVDQSNCFDIWGSQINILQGYFTTAPFVVNTSQIPEIVASENPIVFEIKTQSTGLQALQGEYTITVVDGVTIPEDFQINFNLTNPDYETTIWCKEFPNRSNYALCSVLSNAQGVQITTNSVEDIAQSISEAIQSDIVLNKYFYTSCLDNVVTLKTKEKTSKYNLVWDTNIFIYNQNNILSTTGITFNTIQQGQDAYQGNLVDGYSVYAELYTSDTEEFGSTPNLNNFYPVAELILPYVPTNSMRFNFSDVLKNYVYTPIVDFSFTGFTTLLPCIKPWYITYGEKFFLVENSSTKKKRQKGTTINDIKYVINSSLNWEDQNDMSDYLGEYISNINPNFRLTTSTYYSSFNIYCTDNGLFVSTGTTGTTSVQYSIWNYDNTSIVKGWQNASYFDNTNSKYVNAGSYYYHISGISDGSTYHYYRWFYVAPNTGGQEQTVYPVPYKNVKFLTNEPNPKQIQRNNNSEYLYFILQKDYGFPLDLRGDIYFYDGSSVTDYKFFDITTSEYNFGGVVALACGSDKLGLDAIEHSGSTYRKIKRIDFAIHQFSGTSNFSETRSFKYAIDPAERSFSVMFLNALGGFDNFTFTGIVERSVERTAGIYTVPRAYDIAGASPHSFNVQTTYNTQTIKTISVNSGWINSSTFSWLIELLKSNVIVSSSETFQNYLNVVSFTYKQSSLEDLFDMEIVFRYTTYENNISL